MNPLQLLLIDDDPIFRLGLRVACEQKPRLQVVAEVATATEALQRLTAEGKAVALKPDLVIWTWESGNRSDRRWSLSSGLEVFEDLKQYYPNLPVLILTSLRDPSLLTVAKQAGIRGYCLKGTSIEEIVSAIYQVAAGGSYWASLPEEDATQPSQRSAPLGTPSPSQSLSSVKQPAKFLKPLTFLGQSGLRQIDATLAEVTREWEKARRLQRMGVSAQLDWLFLSGRRRELMAARWIVSQWVPIERGSEAGVSPSPAIESPPLPSPRDSSLPVVRPQSGIRSTSEVADWQAALFATLTSKLQSGLVNGTGVPLEIDIFRLSKKRELLEAILRALEMVLAELRVSQVQPEQLSEKRFAIVRDLWEGAITEFFGKYYTLRTPTEGGGPVSTSEDRSSFVLPPSVLAITEEQATIEVVPTLLQDAEIVQQAILNKIPMVSEFLAHLLFQTPLTIDNTACVGGSAEAMQRSQALLENLILQVANGVVQPLLNNFADLEEIKQKFYDRQLISTREIERFRNDLSWKYRWETYLGEPQAMFESRFWLLTLNEQGIQKISIYAPRNQELARLSGLPLVVTLILEVRDAIAPRFRAAISFLGTGAVYVLTQVIGRGIGLIGRGILQGIGNSLQDSRWERKGDR